MITQAGCNHHYQQRIDAYGVYETCTYCGSERDPAGPLLSPEDAKAEAEREAVVLQYNHQANKKMQRLAILWLDIPLTLHLFPVSLPHSLSGGQATVRIGYLLKSSSSKHRVAIEDVSGVEELEDRYPQLFGHAKARVRAEFRFLVYREFLVALGLKHGDVGDVSRLVKGDLHNKEREALIQEWGLA